MLIFINWIGEYLSAFYVSVSICVYPFCSETSHTVENNFSQGILIIKLIISLMYSIIKPWTFNLGSYRQINILREAADYFPLYYNGLIVEYVHDQWLIIRKYCATYTSAVNCRNSNIFLIVKLIFQLSAGAVLVSSLDCK